MKSSLICFLLVVGLVGAPTTYNIAEARSYSSSGSSSSSSSHPSSPSNNSSSSSRVNSVTNRGSQQTTSVKSNSTAITNPVRASYTPKSVITTTKPASSTIVDNKHIAPNPDNKPTEVRYITRYGTDNKSYSVPLIIPIGMPYNSSLIGDSYFPVAARSTVIYNDGNNGVNIVSGIINAVGIIIAVTVIGSIVIVVLRSFR